MKGVTISDKDILEKHADLEKSCLSKTEKKEVMDMLYRFKDTFSLRHKIGTCPNIRAEIDVIDQSLFFIRPYHAKEGDNAILDKEMNRLGYLCIIRGGFFQHVQMQLC